MLTAKSYDQRYYDEHRLAGLDYAVYGGWQQAYGSWLTAGLDLHGRLVLDAGCACGAIAKGIQDAGAFACVGVDLCEHMIAIGRRQWPELRLHTCDLLNLHLFPDACFDAIHSAQVAEHWRPDHALPILQELRRVTRPGGRLFLALDTEELFARQERSVLTEDPTHICIRSREWWAERLTLAGWTLGSTVELESQRQHLEPLRNHDWDYFLAVAV